MFDTETNELVSATPVKLVERLTHHHNPGTTRILFPFFLNFFVLNFLFPDNQSLLPFLAGFTTVMDAKELLQLLVQRQNVPEPADKSESSLEKYRKQVRTPISMRVFNLLKNWVTTNWSDFSQRPELVKMLNEFLHAPNLAAADIKFAEGIVLAIEKVTILSFFISFAILPSF